MAVTEVLRGLGQWSVQLDPTKLTDEDWKKVSTSYFGHICIHVGRPDVRVSGDSLLRSSRFTGVYVGTADALDAKVLDGFGMAFWLGDADSKGPVREDLLTFPPGTDFDDAIRQLLPASGSVVEGTIHNIPETWAGSHQYDTALNDIDYVCQTVGAFWRVNGDATLDAGYAEQLFTSTPDTIVTSKLINGFEDQTAYEIFLKGLAGAAATDRDVEDFTTRVLLLAQGAEGTSSTASADINPGLNPYKDLHGNDVSIVRIVQELDTDPTNADARAQLQLNRFTGTRDALSLSTKNYDVKGNLEVGDFLWVCDPEMGLLDETNEVPFRGKVINPIKLQLTETTWPIVKGHSVLFRTYDGEWVDLSDCVVWESGDTNIVVGGYNRSLSGASGGLVAGLPRPDTSIPDVVTWNTPFLTGVYQSPGTGLARAEVILTWNRPNNTDGTPIVDGSHYEIRYRRSTVTFYPATWGNVKGEYATWGDAKAAGATWGHGIVYPETDWQTAIAPFDGETFRLTELTPSMPYEAQIRAVDLATPTNYGDWSVLGLWQTTSDNRPPKTPAPPSIAASTLAIQMTHELGVSTGGTFNLDRDLHHLELHGYYEPLFVPDDSTLIGKVLANWGMITGQVPVVASFPLDNLNPVYFKVIAVDESGNKSPASTSVQSTAELVDDAHITSLTVSKVTAGTILANWLLAGSIKTANSGTRFEADVNGLRLYDASNNQTLTANANTGDVTLIGKFQSGLDADDQRIVIAADSGNVSRIDMYDDSSSSHVTMIEFGSNFFQGVILDATGASNGGYSQYQTGTSFFGCQTPSNQAYMTITSAEGISFKGHFQKTVTLSGTSALYADHVAGSGTSATFTYGATMTSQILPFVEILPTSGGFAGKYHCLNASTATGFGVEYPAGNCEIFVWSAKVS